MLDPLKILVRHGRQTIPDLEDVRLPPRFRGLPEISTSPCEQECTRCRDACPTSAVSLSPVSIDLGSCVFCGECADRCPIDKITFTTDFHLAAEEREQLRVIEGQRRDFEPDYSGIREEIQDAFHGSLKLRQVSAGGCNGCELELGACGNVNFDMARFGIEFTASPRHADGIVLTGPVTRAMADPLKICYEAIADPKIVIMTGACAISGGIFAGSDGVDRTVLNDIPIDLYVPGCPPHPLTFITGVLRFVRRTRGH